MAQNTFDFPLLLPRMFGDDDFVRKMKSFVRRYVYLRVIGYSRETAFRRVFGPNNYRDRLMQDRIDMLESTPFFHETYDRGVREIPVDKIINNKIALVELRQMSQDESIRDTVRLAAYNDMLVLAGITEVDPAGNLKKRDGLGAFYADVKAGAHTNGTSKPDDEDTEGMSVERIDLPEGVKPSVH